jgi:hypothetical protein
MPLAKPLSAPSMVSPTHRRGAFMSGYEVVFVVGPLFGLDEQARRSLRYREQEKVRHRQIDPAKQKTRRSVLELFSIE